MRPSRCEFGRVRSMCPKGDISEPFIYVFLLVFKQELHESNWRFGTNMDLTWWRYEWIIIIPDARDAFAAIVRPFWGSCFGTDGAETGREYSISSHRALDIHLNIHCSVSISSRAWSDFRAYWRGFDWLLIELQSSNGMRFPIVNYAVRKLKECSMHKIFLFLCIVHLIWSGRSSIKYPKMSAGQFKTAGCYKLAVNKEPKYFVSVIDIWHKK